MKAYAVLAHGGVFRAMPALLSQATQDYLKAVFTLAQSEHPVATTRLAKYLGVAPASVTNMMKRLARIRLVRHTPYHGVELTDHGEKVALEVIRHHRLLELYLSRALGMRLDRVHGEADRLEHVISEELEEQIASALGQPVLDPHGDPIPTKTGGIIAKPGRVLTETRPCGRVRVVRVSDRSEKIVRELTEAGLLPGVVAEVVAVGPQRVDIRIEGRTHRLSAGLAAAIYVMDLEAEGRRARRQALDPGRSLQTRRVPHA